MKNICEYVLGLIIAVLFILGLIWAFPLLLICAVVIEIKERHENKKISKGDNE